jgi:hypothetical protein
VPIITGQAPLLCDMQQDVSGVLCWWGFFDAGLGSMCGGGKHAGTLHQVLACTTACGFGGQLLCL